MICGYDRSMSALDFHHRNPNEKDFGLGRGRIRNWEFVKLELDKCDLLCKNCHAEIHDSWRASSIEKQKSMIMRIPKNPQRMKPCSNCGSLLKRKSSKFKCKITFCNSECKNEYKLKLGIKPWPSNEDLEKLVNLMPMTKISAYLGVSDRSVKQQCVKNGIKTHGVGYWNGKTTDSNVI